MIKKVLAGLALACLLTGTAFAQDALMRALYGTGRPPAFELSRVVDPAGGGTSDMLLSGEASKALKTGDVLKIHFDLSFKTFTEGRFPAGLAQSQIAGGMKAVVFGAVGIGSSGTKGLGMSKLASGRPDFTVAPLVVTGPCFKRIVAVPAVRRIIRVGCDPQGPGDWLVVPVTMDKAARNDLGGGFVTGRAGFYEDNGQKMFFVEYYAWPEDPVQIGG